MVIEWQKSSSIFLENEVCKDDIALIVISSCEQHARHLPVGTDAYIGEAIAYQASHLSKRRVFLLPAFNFGFSRHHLGFPGTLSVSQNLLVSFISDICNILEQSSVKQIVILNSHGGNQTSLQYAINENASNSLIKLVLIRYWDFISEEMNDIRDSPDGGIGHAGELETSLMEYLAPETVNTLEKNYPYKIIARDKWFSPDMFAKNRIYQFKHFKEYGDHGNVGDPKYASALKGEQIFNLIVKKISQFLDDFPFSQHI